MSQNYNVLSMYLILVPEPSFYITIPSKTSVTYKSDKARFLLRVRHYKPFSFPFYKVIMPKGNSKAPTQLHTTYRWKMYIMTSDYLRKIDSSKVSNSGIIKLQVSNSSWKRSDQIFFHLAQPFAPIMIREIINHISRYEQGIPQSSQLPSISYNSPAIIPT